MGAAYFSPVYLSVSMWHHRAMSDSQHLLKTHNSGRERVYFSNVLTFIRYSQGFTVKKYLQILEVKVFITLFQLAAYMVSVRNGSGDGANMLKMSKQYQNSTQST